MPKKFISVFLLCAVFAFTFFNCTSEEEKELARLKKEDPLFYDTNNEIIRMVEKLQIGMSQEEFMKWFRVEDPSMLIKGRSSTPFRKHVVDYRENFRDSTFLMALGDITSVPEYHIALVTFKDSVVIKKELLPGNLEKIGRFRKAVKINPGAKPVFYNIEN